MLRSVCALSLMLLNGCASTWTGAPAAGRLTAPAPLQIDASLAPDTCVNRSESAAPAALPGFEAPPVDGDAVPAAPSDSWTTLQGPPRRSPLRENRFTIKGGYYDSTEDSLDDGYIVNGAWTQFLNQWTAVEFEIGYLDAEGTDGAVRSDVWAIPFMINGRLNAPLGMLDVYGGLGFGSIYYDARTNAGSFLSANFEGWLLAGDAFAGASINLGDRMAIGIEAKYYLTEHISHSGDGLDAFALMLTLGFSL